MVYDNFGGEKKLAQAIRQLAAKLKELLVKQKANLLVAGSKERFLAYKLGIAFCDFNHDRTVSFERFNGMVNFAREVDISVNSPVWKLPLLREGPSAQNAALGRIKETQPLEARANV